MDQGLSNVLDDKDEFELDDRDEFYADVQRVFHRTRHEATISMEILKNRGYETTIYREDETPFSPVTWVVEGKR